MWSLTANAAFYCQCGLLLSMWPFTANPCRYPKIILKARRDEWGSLRPPVDKVPSQLELELELELGSELGSGSGLGSGLGSGDRVEPTRTRTRTLGPNLDRRP